MPQDPQIVREVPGLYRLIPLRTLRRTRGAFFDLVPRNAFPRIDSIDRVIHEPGTVSPGPVDDVERPWYMHTSQDDNLLVLHGTRYVQIYTPQHGRIEDFIVTSHSVEKSDGVEVFNGPAMLVWPRGVFHRIRSCPREGSASVNFAVHYDGFDIRTNFHIYDLDVETGEYRVIREGHLDQPEG